MTPVEALDRLHKALALAPYLKTEKARELVRIFPYLPPEVRNDRGEVAWEVLREWNSWGHLDVPDYINALRVLVPYVSEDQTLTLWAQAVSEWKSNDSERRHFAELSLVLITKHMSVPLLRNVWKQVNPDKFGNYRARAEFLVTVGNRLPDYRSRLHAEAWQVASADAQSEDWFGTIVQELDPELCWEQWLESIARIRSKEPEAPLDVCYQVTALVDGIPEISAQQACMDLCNLDSFRAYRCRIRFATAISRLIQRAPFETERIRLLTVVIDHLIELGMKPYHLCDPYILAGELLCRVPEEIRGDQWSRLVNALRRK